MSAQQPLGRNRRPLMRLTAFVAVVAALAAATGPGAGAEQAAAPARAPSAGATTQPAPEAMRPRHRPAPESFLRSQRQQRDMSRNIYNGIRQGSTYRLDALLQFRMVNGALDVQAAALPVGEQTRIKVEGSNAVWLGFRQPQNFNFAFAAAPLGVAPTTSTVTRVTPTLKGMTRSGPLTST